MIFNDWLSIRHSSIDECNEDDHLCHPISAQARLSGNISAKSNHSISPGNFLINL